jgi:D-arabinose 5-phosphate isomerase GutQ/GTP-binding protein EngB required for normal cell division
MRAFKKISTPFIKSRPNKAIIVMNGRDPQINTIRAFIQACDDYNIGYTVFVNKIDTNGEKEHPDVEKLRESLELKDINYGSATNNIGIRKMAKYLELWEGKRIAVLGVFNAGKTSLINAICGTELETGDIPGTTLEFTEVDAGNNTILIDSVGQLIDIHKPLMVSIDFSECSDIKEKIDKVFDEEILGLVQTKESSKCIIKEAVETLRRAIDNDKKIIVVGAGASALVAKEMAGQGTECGIPIMSFTNDGAEIQPITFSKGLGEEEESIARYVNLCINEGDIVIGISASGGTGFVYDSLRKAKKKGALTIAITENIDTPLGHNANIRIKSDAKPEGPSSSKIQTAHLVIGHSIILTLADELGVTADESVGHMLPEPLDNKKMGIK